MNKSFSVYLDAVRFVAAIGVFVSHLAYPRLTGGVMPSRLVDMFRASGDDFVMVFFVLSGFVIAYTVQAKDRHWRDYVFNRATRIYSVALPAILAGFLLDRVGVAFNPADYDGFWYQEQPLYALLIRGLTFSNEFWPVEFRMGTNGPFWSLGYEVWYYILFGIAVFARGWGRIVSFIIAALLIGPAIWLLAPVWFMGVLFYEAFRRGWFSQQQSMAMVTLAALMAAIPLLLFAGIRLTGLQEYFYGGSAAILQAANLESLQRPQHFLWSWTVGALVTLHFAGAALFFSSLPITLPAPLVSAIRWLAGASFSIYLVHYPAMIAIDALLIGDTSAPLRAAVLAVSTLAICFAFASVFERRLKLLRAFLKSSAASIPAPGAANAIPKPRR